MSHLLPTIDLSLLERATGGNGDGGPNQTNITGELKVKTPMGVEASGQGSYQSRETDYARCIGTAMSGGAKPADLPAICGKPPGSN